MNSSEKVSWWRINYSNEDIEKVTQSIRNENISMGAVTEEFENKMADALDVPYVLATVNGSVALLMSMMALGIKAGDEVIVPNRTWIATAHAPMMLGAKLIMVDVLPTRPVMDTSLIKEKINSRTRAIIPAALCGCAVEMEDIWNIARDYNIFVVEDAAQALFSKYKGIYMGTKSDLGCFSMSISKLVTSGQGGFITIQNKNLYEELQLIRTHGVKNVIDASPFMRMGFNFRYTDLHASIALVQLGKVQNRISNIKKIYSLYQEALKKINGINLIPVDIEHGEIPLYVEVIVDEREKLVEYLSSKNIQTRRIYPDLDSAKYLDCEGAYPNSRIFGKKGLVLPCGPDQPIDNIERVIESLFLFK